MKTYIKPESRSIELLTEQPILSGSDPIKKQDGYANGADARSNKVDIWNNKNWLSDNEE